MHSAFCLERMIRGRECLTTEIVQFYIGSGDLFLRPTHFFKSVNVYFQRITANMHGIQCSA